MCTKSLRIQETIKMVALIQIRTHIVQSSSTDHQWLNAYWKKIEQLYKCFTQYTVLALATGFQKEKENKKTTNGL